MPVRTVLLLILAAVGYLVFPLDLIPDGFIGPGQLDDIVVLMALAYFLFKYLPRHGGVRWRDVPADAPASDVASTDAASEFEERFASTDPYIVLGISRTAAGAEIKAAYRELLALYHPDKVAHLSREFQTLAHERVVAIQRAYTGVAEA